jgi:ATP-dependent Clp protease protease subunit
MKNNTNAPPPPLEMLGPKVELMMNGIYMFISDVTMESMGPVIEWILSANLRPNKPKELTLGICSRGGDLNACFALVDIIKGSKIPIRTVGLGMIASCGLLLFISGAKGTRTLTPNTAILSHQYTWGKYGKEHELFAANKEMELTSKRITEHYRKCTGLSEKDIKKHLMPPHDVWLSAKEAKKLGVCDNIKKL